VRLEHGTALCRGFAFQVVDLVGEQPLEFGFPLGRQGQLFHRISESMRTARKQIGTEGLPVEEADLAEPVRREQVVVVELGAAAGIDADLPDDLLRHRRVGLRRLDKHRAAVADEHAPVERELITFRVTAKVIVIVEDEDACVRVHITAIDVRRR